MVTDAFITRKKQEVMQDTWGHLYPEPGKKYPGKMVIAKGIYGDEVIVSSIFPGLESSPQRYELEHTIFEKYNEEGLFHIACTLWFFKTSSEIYTGKSVGKIINIKEI